MAPLKSGMLSIAYLFEAMKASVYANKGHAPEYISAASATTYSGQDVWSRNTAARVGKHGP